MADSREVYAWPELSLFVWQGASSAQLAYAESIDLTVDDSYQKFLFMTTGVDYQSRSQFVETDRNVRMNVGRLYAGASLFQLMDSAVNISAVMTNYNTADNVSAQFILYSARIPSYQLAGREGQLWRDSISIIAPNVSGL